MRSLFEVLPIRSPTRFTVVTNHVLKAAAGADQQHEWNSSRLGLRKACALALSTWVAPALLE